MVVSKNSQEPTVHPLVEHSLQILKPFEDSKALRHLKLSFAVRKFRDRLDFDFVLTGRSPVDIATVVLPGVGLGFLSQAGSSIKSVERRHELWKSTCLEVFFGPVDQSSYFELNLAPSGDWNVYQFDAYRTGFREHPGLNLTLKKTTQSQNGDSVTWHLSLEGRAMSGDDPLKVLLTQGLVMGASAVMEYTSGEKEYWALIHAGPKPDFHLRESFRLIL
jgi:hypothetical protein